MKTNRIAYVTNELMKKVPEQFHAYTEDMVQKSGEQNPIFMNLPIEEVVRFMYDILIQNILYELEWNKGDVLINENNKNYIIVKDENESASKAYKLLNVEEGTLVAGREYYTITHMKEELKRISSYKHPLCFKKIVKKGEKMNV